MQDTAVISRPKRGPRLEKSERLPEVLSTYLRWHRIEGHTDDTISFYRRELGRFFRFLEGQEHSLVLPDLTEDDILDYLGDIKERGNAPRTVKSSWQAITTFLTWCEERGRIEQNPARWIKAPKVPRTRKPFLKVEQFEQLLSYCPQNTFIGARRAAMLWMMATTGIRRREMSLLNLEDMDWEGGTIRVIHGKGQKERVVTFTLDCQRAVFRYLEHRTDKGRELWVSQRGQPIKYHAIGLDLSRLREWCGIEYQDVCHNFRRLFAASSVKQNIPLAYIRSAAGWTSDQMIARYSAWMEEESGEIRQRYRDFQPFLSA